MTDDIEVTLTTSQTIGAIAAAMAKAQLEMEPAVKDSTNPHFKSNYASLASCLAACKPLHKQGIAVFQPPQPAGPDGVRVVTLLVHSSGEWIRGELYMPAAKRDPQGFGSALSYARRYCLSSTANLAADDDDGQEAQRSKPGPARSAPPAPPAPVDPRLFASFCDRVDAAETVAALNSVAQGALKASRDRVLTDEQFNTIKRAVETKRASFGQSATNGGAA